MRSTGRLVPTAWNAFAAPNSVGAAANKTIVHPEKLTLSKAEHAAARKQ